MTSPRNGSFHSAREGAAALAAAARAAANQSPDPVQLRREQLRQMLPATVDYLRRRRADLIRPTDIDDYVAIGWLEWQGGSLRLTETGNNVCAQLGLRKR